MKRSLVLSIATSACLAFWVWLAGASESRLEYEVKAAFLYNFAKFVEWPVDAFGQDDDEFALCIVGQDPFGSDLERVVRGRSANGRPIRIRRGETVADLGRCHMLFVGRAEDESMAHIMQDVGASPVLTVGETPTFADGGGIIHLVVDASRVRFEIDAKAAERARLKVSSQLLKLARTVKR